MAEAKKVRRCVIYSRVSSEEQARGKYTSIEGQEDRCKHAIAMKEDQGWVLTNTFRDPGYSGKDLNRPGIKQLIAKVQAGEIDVILTYRIDRLSRSILAFYDFYPILKEHNVELFSLSESIDTTTTSGRLMLNTLLNFAQYERELTSERVKHKLTQHANRGNFIGGILPFGYVCPKDSPIGDKVLIVEPKEAEVVKLIFKLYTQLKSLGLVCDELHRRGIVSRTRAITKRDGTKAVIGGTPFYPSRLLIILRNPVYKGQISYDKVLYAGKHQAIIPPKAFDAVQGLLDKNARPGLVPHRDEHVHLLKGLAHCGHCHAALTPYASGKKSRKSSEPYLYYACTSKTHKRKGPACPLPLLPARALEATVKQFLKATCKSSKTLAAALQTESRHSHEVLGPLQAKQDELARERKRVESAISNFLDAIGQHGIGSADLRSRYERSVERRDAIEREVEFLNLEITSAETRVLDLATIKLNLQAFESVIDSLSIEDQKQLFQVFIKRVSIWRHDEAGEAAEGLLTSFGEKRKHEVIYRLVIELHQLPGLDPPKLGKLTRAEREDRPREAATSQEPAGPSALLTPAEPRGREFVFHTSSWAMADSNHRPAACKAAALPLS